MALLAGVKEDNFNFTLRYYSEKTKSLGTGRYFPSRMVQIGGHSWRIKYYPNGCAEQEDGETYVSVGVQLCNSRSTPWKAIAEGVLTICDQNKSTSADDISHKWSHTFAFHPATEFRIVRFCSKYDLEDPSKSLVQNDSVLMKCTIRVFKCSGPAKKWPLRLLDLIAFWTLRYIFYVFAHDYDAGDEDFRIIYNRHYALVRKRTRDVATVQ